MSAGFTVQLIPNEDASAAFTVGEEVSRYDLHEGPDEAEITPTDPSKACLVTVSFKNDATDPQKVALYTPTGNLGSSQTLAPGDEVEFKALLPAGRSYAIDRAGTQITGIIEQPIG